ncbi:MULTISPECIES: hypothetical protein [unclassified Streptomyces]|uniref:hypothetical protein n=1 Tax=unclassified Streptomyces TaxID=2593676 RepID=UPI0037F61B22
MPRPPVAGKQAGRTAARARPAMFSQVVQAQRTARGDVRPQRIGDQTESPEADLDHAPGAPAARVLDALPG